MNPVLQGRKGRTQIIPQNMVGKPTIFGTDGPNAQQWTPNASPYFAIEVDATAQSLVDANVPIQVVLFDSNRQYQQRTNYFMPLDLAIRSRTDVSYQALIDDINEVAAVVDVLQMQICNATDPNCNFNFFPSLDLMYSQRGQQPSLIKTIHPDMGVSENQYHLNRATFQADMVITQRHALLFTIQPGEKTLLAFYQSMELGRKY
jgi:hypothetical protein